MSEVKTYSVQKSVILNAPVPEQTRTYKPFSNNQLIDLTLNGLHNAGYILDREYYSSAKEGMVSVGKYTVANVEDDEMQLQISWRNSYDKSLPLVFSVGCLIKVCSNGMMKSIGGGSFRKKHQGEIQDFTPRAISEYIKTGGGLFEEMQREREEMKQIELNRTLQAQIIGEMFVENEFIKSTQLNIIKRELDAPTHSYGDPNSLWSLYQYTTFSMREVHPSLYVQDHLDAHSFFVEKAKIIVPTQNIVIPEPESPFQQLDLFEELYQ